MKEITTAHEYKLIVHVTSLVPDYYDESDVLTALQDYPIGVTIDDLWADEYQPAYAAKSPLADQVSALALENKHLVWSKSWSPSVPPR